MDSVEGMSYLREYVPDRFEQLLQYFDNTHVSVSYRQTDAPQRQYETIPPFRIRSKPLIITPSIVHSITLEGSSMLI